MPLNDCSDFGSILAYTCYFFSWVGRLAFFVSSCFSLKKKRWGLAPHITQTIAEIKGKILNTWFKNALHSGSASRSRTGDSPGSSRAAMCYSICVLFFFANKVLAGMAGWKDHGLCAVSWVRVVS